MTSSAIRKIFYEFRDFSVIFFRAFRRGKISEKSGTSKIFEYCTRNHAITNLLSTQKKYVVSFLFILVFPIGTYWVFPLPFSSFDFRIFSHFSNFWNSNANVRKLFERLSAVNKKYLQRIFNEEKTEWVIFCFVAVTFWCKNYSRSQREDHFWNTATALCQQRKLHALDLVWKEGREIFLTWTFETFLFTLVNIFSTNRRLHGVRLKQINNVKNSLKSWELKCKDCKENDKWQFVCYLSLKLKHIQNSSDSTEREG